jgi:hypothetical protein
LRSHHPAVDKQQQNISIIPVKLFPYFTVFSSPTPTQPPYPLHPVREEIVYVMKRHTDQPLHTHGCENLKSYCNPESLLILLSHNIFNAAAVTSSDHTALSGCTTDSLDWMISAWAAFCLPLGLSYLVAHSVRSILIKSKVKSKQAKEAYRVVRCRESHIF